MPFRFTTSVREYLDPGFLMPAMEIFDSKFVAAAHARRSDRRRHDRRPATWSRRSPDSGSPTWAASHRIRHGVGGRIDVRHDRRAGRRRRSRGRGVARRARATSSPSTPTAAAPAPRRRESRSRRSTTAEAVATLLADRGFERWDHWTGAAARSFRAHAEQITVARTDRPQLRAPAPLGRLLAAADVSAGCSDPCSARRRATGRWCSSRNHCGAAYSLVRPVRLVLERIGRRDPHAAGLGPFLSTPQSLIDSAVRSGAARTGRHAARHRMRRRTAGGRGRASPSVVVRSASSTTPISSNGPAVPRRQPVSTTAWRSDTATRATPTCPT